MEKLDCHFNALAHNENCWHLHGSLHQPRCWVCAETYTLPEQPLSDQPIDLHSRITPPCCPHCDGVIRPGVVWFGEVLPTKAWQLAEQACAQCDLMLVIGTSGLVWPVQCQ